MKLPEPIYFKDYQPSDYTITSCSLEFIIDNGSTRVDNVMEIKRQNPHAKELRLDGEMMDLELLWVNDTLLDQTMYQQDENSLTLPIG